jgi:hypothetical protein
MVYSARTYEDFRRKFALQVVRDYLNIVVQQQILNNARDQVERLRAGHIQPRLAQAGALGHPHGERRRVATRPAQLNVRRPDRQGRPAIALNGRCIDGDLPARAQACVGTKGELIARL